MTATDRPSQQESGQGEDRLRLVVAGVTWALVLIGMGRVWLVRWVCDDAFISFRYARNLVDGHGLVWNPGEYVEGYTNLLWTLLMAAGEALQLDSVLLSQLLGMASMLLLATALWLFSRAWSSRVAAPLAVWMASSMEDMQIWTTGGLETITVAALTAWAALLLFGGSLSKPAADGERSSRGLRETAAGVVCALLVLLRPDTILLSGGLLCAYVISVWSRGERLVTLVRLATPLILAVLGSTAFRVAYYGEWLPNTFYAKSASEAYLGQGLTYVGLFLAKNYVLVPLLVLGTWLAMRRCRGPGRPWMAAAALGSTSLLFALYVIWTGGDFMFARRLVPAIPLLLLCCEIALMELGSARLHLGVCLALVLATALPYPVYERWGSGNRIGDVAEEPAFYPDEVVQLRRSQGEALGRVFAGIDSVFLLEGGLCMLAYYSRLPTLIEGNGLTDWTIARQSLEDRGMVGHEKRAPPWYLEERRVNFIVLNRKLEGPFSFDTVEIGGGLLQLRTILYDEVIMETLKRRPGVRFVPVGALLARMEKEIGRGSCERARAHLSMLERYYLRWNPEAVARRRTMEQLVEARCAR